MFHYFVSIYRFQQLDKEVSEFVDPPPEIQVKLDQLRRFAYDSFPFTSVKVRMNVDFFFCLFLSLNSIHLFLHRECKLPIEITNIVFI